MNVKKLLEFRVSSLELPARAERSRGFTLTEMIVVIGILALIMGSMAFVSREGKENTALRLAAQTITQAVHEAKNSSLGGKEHEGSVSEGGYGIYADLGADEIILFADCNLDNQYTPTGTGASSCENAPAEGQDFPETVRVFNLEQLVTITDLSRQNNSGNYISCGANCSYHTVFVPPNPTTEFLRDAGSPSPISTNEIQIELTSGSDSTIFIYINKLGATRIEN